MSSIYISGGITNVPNFKIRFAAAQTTLEDHGYSVVNPVNVHPKICPCLGFSHTWECYMRYDLIAMLEHCDKVATLDRWELSRGANVELLLAKSLGFKVASVNQWIVWSRSESVAY